MTTPLTRQDIEDVVLHALTLANQTRTADHQLAIAATAPIFGSDSTLDSLGLVALLIDVEDLLRERGCDITIGDERAMSQRRSPFRDVATLVDYIDGVLASTGA